MKHSCIGPRDPIPSQTASWYNTILANCSCTIIHERSHITRDRDTVGFFPEALLGGVRGVRSAPGCHPAEGDTRLRQVPVPRGSLPLFWNFFSCTRCAVRMGEEGVRQRDKVPGIPPSRTLQSSLPAGSITFTADWTIAAASSSSLQVHRPGGGGTLLYSICPALRYSK